MATMDFPASPSTGDIHTHSGKRWQWDGAVWRAYSLAFTGTPVAPTAAAGTDTTQIATTAYVQTELEVIPGIGNTLTFEGSSADDFETTLTVVDPTADRTVTLQNADGTVAFVNSEAFTGTPTAPTAAADTSTTQLATTAFVMTEVGDYAPLASPALTGNPTAPTQSASNNSTRIATTAYVDASGGSSDEIVDADSDTKIQVEESADEDKIRFDTGGTQRAVLDSSGLEIFTGGLKLDNLESDNVNTLDDYEEGTFTGSFSVQNGTVTISSSYNTGGYTKVGRMVHIQFSAAVDSFSGNSGQLYIEGMPFTSMPVGVSTSLTYSRLPVSVFNLNADVGQGAAGQLPHNYTQVSVSASDCCSSNRPIGGDLKQYTEVCINGSYYVDS